MRLTSILFHNARRPQNENKVPFKGVLPLELRNFVSGKNQRLTEQGCFQEMSSLLTCLEENEFEDKKCIPQLKALNQCYQVYLNNKQSAHSTKEKTPIPHSKNLTHNQVTRLLRKYPTV